MFLNTSLHERFLPECRLRCKHLFSRGAQQVQFQSICKVSYLASQCSSSAEKSSNPTGDAERYLAHRPLTHIFELVSS
jgi:hypothetical protein